MTESLEVRLAKAAQSLDAGAERYAHKRSSNQGKQSDPRRRARAITRTVLAVGSIAAAAVLVVGLSSARRVPSTVNDPSKIASVGQLTRQLLASVSSVTINLPGQLDGQLSQAATLIDGTAKLDDGGVVVVTDADLINDVNGDGLQDAVLLVTRYDRPDSSVASIHVVTLAASDKAGDAYPSKEIARTLGYYQAENVYSNAPAPAFSGIIQISQTRTTKSCCQADVEFTDFVYADGVLSPIGSRTLTRSQLGDVADQFHEIKFFVGTDSGIVDLTENEATGWFWARAGQTLTIRTNNKTFQADGSSRFRRTIVIRLQAASESVASAEVAANKSEPSQSSQSLSSNSASSKSTPSKSTPSKSLPAQTLIGQGELPDDITFELPVSGRYQLFADASGDPSGFVDGTSGESTMTLTIK